MTQAISRDIKTGHQSQFVWCAKREQNAAFDIIAEKELGQ
jgi:hypothetical protein